MSEDKVKGYINELFANMNAEVKKMVVNSMSSKQATENIVHYVSSKIASASRGYMSTIYSDLSDKTLKEPLFQVAKNANEFFNLELDQKIVESYKFDVQCLPHFDGGIDFREINRGYTTAAAGVGTAAIGGVLLGVLSGIVDIPLIGIIAGAIVVGLLGSGVACYKVIPEINEQRLLEATKAFMSNLENETYRWVDGVVVYYHTQVDELKKALQGG